MGAGAASGSLSKKHSRRNVVPSLVDYDSRSYDNGFSSEVPGVGEALPPLGASDDRGPVMVTSGASGDAHVMDDRLRVGSFTGSDSSGADDTAALKLNRFTGGGIADDKAALELIPPKGGVVDELSSPGIRPDRDKRPEPPVKCPTERGLAAVHQVRATSGTALSVFIAQIAACLHHLPFEIVHRARSRTWLCTRPKNIELNTHSNTDA